MAGGRNLEAEPENHFGYVGGARLVTRRALLSTAIGIPLAGVASAEPVNPRAAIKAVLDGKAPFAHSIIQCLVPPGEEMPTPWQEESWVWELVWSKETTVLNVGTLHQRLYALVGTLPKGFDPTKSGFLFGSVIERTSPMTAESWKDITP